MNAIQVDEQADVGELAALFAHTLRQEEQLHTEGRGPQAIQRMLEAVIGARQVLAAEGKVITCVPDYAAVQAYGEAGTAVLLTVEALDNPDQAARQGLAGDTLRDEIRSDFDQRQDWAQPDNELQRKLAVHNADSPILSGGDVDAAWEKSDVGEETVGGMAPTPDQDVVDELGEAVGLTYEDDEVLRSGEKLAERDRSRWELDPASATETDGRGR